LHEYEKLGPVVVKICGEHKFATLDLEDLYHALMYHEKSTLDFVLGNFPEGSNFIDVGANIGGYSVRLGTRGRVFAFEPDPRNYRLLALNVDLNKLTNIRTYNKAVGDHIGKAKLYLSRFHGRHSTIEGSVRGGTKYVIIDSVTLDSMLAELDSVQILKVDVEGAELFVLKGGIRTLEKTKYVIVECSTAYAISTVNQFLISRGFHFLERFGQNRIFMKVDSQLLISRVASKLVPNT
jgi:FkbM family methyltransferase